MLLQFLRTKNSQMKKILRNHRHQEHFPKNTVYDFLMRSGADKAVFIAHAWYIITRQTDLVTVYFHKSHTSVLVTFGVRTTNVPTPRMTCGEASIVWTQLGYCVTFATAGCNYCI